MSGLIDVWFDSKYRVAEWIGWNRPEATIKMCWTVPPRYHPAQDLPPGYRYERIGEPGTMPEGWASVLCRAGLEATANTWQYEYVEREIIEVVLVRKQKAIAGVAGVRRVRCANEEAAVLSYVGVAPEYRGLRLGRFLTTQAMAAAADVGIRTVYLATDDSRLPAIKTYIGQGFRPCLNSWDRSHHLRWSRIGEELGVSVKYCRNRDHRAAIARLGT